MQVIGTIKTQRFFIHFYMSMDSRVCDCVFDVFVLRECGTLIVPKKRTSKMIFLLLHSKDSDSHF